MASGTTFEIVWHYQDDFVTENSEREPKVQMKVRNEDDC